MEYLCDHFGSARPTLVPQRYTPGSEGKVGGETEEWMRYRYFMHYVEGSLMPFLVMSVVNDCKCFFFFLRAVNVYILVLALHGVDSPRYICNYYLKQLTFSILTAIRNAPPFFVRPITGMVASQVENHFLNRNIDGNLAFLEEQLRTSPEGGEYICGKELTAADILLSFPVIAVTGRALKQEKNKDKYPLIIQYAKRLENNEGYQRAVKKIEKIEGKFSASM